jgi:hypothetical protein
MFDAGHDVAFCGAIGSQFVCDHDARRVPVTFQKLSHQMFGRLGIVATLHQYAENKTVLIDGAPKPVFLATNRDDDLIEVPFAAEPSDGSPANFAGKVPTKFLRPQSNGLVRNDNATSCEQVRDDAQAQRKAKVQPNGVGNHLCGKSMTAIKGITSGLCHAAKITHFPRRLVEYSVPAAELLNSV